MKEMRIFVAFSKELEWERNELASVLYGTNYRVFARKEIENIHERGKDGDRDPKRFYVFFRELDEKAEKSLDETSKAFRSDSVTKPGNDCSLPGSKRSL